MRILLDITHPAHLHFFRPAIGVLRAQGHDLMLTGRDKDILRRLASEMDVAIDFFGGSPPGVVGLGWTLLSRTARLQKIVRRFRPDVMAALGGTFIGFLSWANRIPSVVFYDTENATVSNLITYPFASRVCTPDAYLRCGFRNNVRYAGYHELAYLSPRRFRPDPTVRAELGVGEDEPFSLVRFVGWEASHDLGHSGLSGQQKQAVVDRLSQAGRVFISSEGVLPEALEPLRFPLPVRRMHDAIAAATLVVGESSTMCSEAAVLGVPSVFIHPPIERGYTKDQHERWGIVHWITPDRFSEALDTAERIMQQREVARWRAIGDAIVADSVDVTDFVCEQILSSGQAGRRRAAPAKV